MQRPQCNAVCCLFLVRFSVPGAGSWQVWFLAGSQSSSKLAAKVTLGKQGGAGDRELAVGVWC